jgi:hypothetical protein
MNLRVRILHFADGVVISGRSSISGELLPGVPCAKSVRRLPDGYLIDFNGKLYVVHDAQVKYAEVVDMDAPVEPEAPAPDAPAPLRPAAPLPKAVDTATLQPGDLYVNDRGVYSRWYPDGMTKEQYEASKNAPAAAPTPAADPAPYKPRPRARRATSSKVESE